MIYYHVLSLYFVAENALYAYLVCIKIQLNTMFMNLPYILEEWICFFSITNYAYYFSLQFQYTYYFSSPSFTLLNQCPLPVTLTISLPLISGILLPLLSDVLSTSFQFLLSVVLLLFLFSVILFSHLNNQRKFLLFNKKT